VITIKAPIPTMLHLYLPAALFRRLADDFNLPGVPPHSIRYVAGVRDEVINQIELSIISAMTNETAAGRMFVETASATKLADQRMSHLVKSDEKHVAGNELYQIPLLLLGHFLHASVAAHFSDRTFHSGAHALRFGCRLLGVKRRRTDQRHHEQHRELADSSSPAERPDIA
jgi:hypothetical protein